MEKSRTQNAMLILFSSSIRQFLTLITTFIIRTVFIRTLGSEYLGLSGLFTNILSLLALSELGIGTAITFYLYKPIEEKNIERIKSLMLFYKTLYRLVGLAIIGFGLILIPILPYLVNFDQNLDINLYAIYVLYLLNTSSSYLLFAYKQSFLMANQRQYKIEQISTAFSVIQFFLDLVNIAIVGSFYLYLIGGILIILLKNICISIEADKTYAFLREKNIKKISVVEFKNIFNDVFSVSIFKVGSQLFNATDNIIISIMLGTTIVGYYSNYYLIISYATLMFGMIVKSFTAGIGNVSVKESEEKRYLIYKRIDFLMFVISTVASVCMCQMFNSFMKIWIGSLNNNYIFSQVVVFILSFDYYMNCTCQTPNIFRETSGNFYTGKWLQLIGGVFNIALSLVLVSIWGLAGIFFATIVCKLLITVTPFLWMIAKTVFHRSSLPFVMDYYKKIFLRLAAVFIVWIACSKVHMTNIFGLIAEGVICILVSLGLIFICYRRTDEMKFLKNKLGSMKKMWVESRSTYEPKV
jgi:O-antigen/teichoic acid export membrane protein